MSTTRVNFRLPEELVERADLAAAVTGETRTGIVTDALREHLRTLEGSDSFEAALVERYLDGDVELDALRSALDPRDAEAVRVSKSLIEDGEDLAGAVADASEDRP